MQGQANPIRFCVTEAAIDAMSLAALEELKEGTLYLSTGGGWALATEDAIRRLCFRPGAQLVAATDNNNQGEAFAKRIAAIGVAAGCRCERLRPVLEDWNEDLCARIRKRKER